MEQLSLFSSVLHAYSAEHHGQLSNAELYDIVAQQNGIPEAVMKARVPIGVSGQLHNPIARSLRWHQQTLKNLGVLEHVSDARGVWRLTEPAGHDLHRIAPTVVLVGFSTELGVALLGSCESVFARIDDPISLVLCSPPYPVSKKRHYGGPSEVEYVDWICRTLEPVVRALAPGGSICLNISNDIFEPGLPSRSLYVERLLLALNDRLSLRLMDRLIWQNRAKAPGPIAWASKERVQLHYGYEPIYWLSPNPRLVRSNNQRVLQAHSERHLKLIAQGGEQRHASYSDGAYRLHPGRFGTPTAGRIPRNVLEYGHTCADQREYKRSARAQNLPVHGAPMPLKLAEFLVEFMTEPGDLVADPYAGSFTTCKAAERLGRRWLGTEVMVEYVLGAASRFQDAPGFQRRLVA